MTAKQDAALLDKLRAAGVPLPANPGFARTYAGRWQRAQGAWAWFIIDTDTGHPACPGVGSQVPRASLRGALEITPPDDYNGRDWHIDPA